MNKKKISVEIQKSINDVFYFTIDPINTPRWIDHLEIEETSEWPPKPGTIYRNRSVGAEWSEYVVVAFELNKIFELVSKDGNYHVRYSYTEMESDHTQMEYFEWVDQGNLEQPFVQKTLEKLKAEIEERT